MSTIETRADFRPAFLDVGGRPIFAIYYPPSAQAGGPDFDLICLPPFAEELNRSRRMMALQARALAAQGIGVVVLDFFGTGDSGGDFVDGRWDLWLDDARAGADWLASMPERPAARPIGLWGIRLGALAAAALVTAEPARFDRLVLWSPVPAGQTYVNQVLRIRVAAELGRSDAGVDAGGATGRGLDTKALRAQLHAGEIVEVAGYGLHPELIAAIDSLRLVDLIPPAGFTVNWFELVPEAGREAPPVARSTAARWREAGVPVTEIAAVGPPFFSLPDTTEDPAVALIRATADHLSG